MVFDFSLSLVKDIKRGAITYEGGEGKRGRKYLKCVLQLFL
jgi:hypothetical protein